MVERTSRLAARKDMEMKLAFSLLGMVVLICGPCSAQGIGSGDSYKAGCNILITGTPHNALEIAQQAVCIGTVAAVLGIGWRLQEPGRFCIPQTVTIEQGVRVLMKFFSENPQRTHEPITDLAVDAFHAAWPCRK